MDLIVLTDKDFVLSKMAIKAWEDFPITAEYLPALTDTELLKASFPPQVAITIWTRLTGTNPAENIGLAYLQGRGDMEGNDFGNLLQDGYLLIRTMLMDRIDGPPVENPELTQKYEATIRCLNDAVVRMGDRELRAAMNNALTDLKAMRMVALADEAMTLEAAKSELGRSRP